MEQDRPLQIFFPDYDNILAQKMKLELIFGY